MPGSNNLYKLQKTIREDGLMTAAQAVAGHSQRTVAGFADGLPGHYRIRRALLQRRYHHGDISPRWVSPSDITALTGEYERREEGHLDYVPYFKPREASWDTLPFKRELPYGSTVEGDWDLHREPFSKLLMYRGICQHYIDGLPWSETVYYDTLTERFCNQGLTVTVADSLAMERCENIEAVYQEIESNGYRSQRELNGHPLHEVTITVARDGTFLYNCEGRHRLSIAKVLDIEKIPVLVLARHAEYDPQNARQDEHTKHP